MTLHAIEARLRMEPELNKLEANVMQALARAVMRFAQVTTKGGDWGDLPGPHHDQNRRHD